MKENVKERYEVKQVIGKGSTSIVCLGLLKGLTHSKEEVAIKAVNKARLSERSERVKNLLLEIRVHWSLAECSSAV